MAKRNIFNARTQQVEKAELTVDHNGEIVATFEDGGFIKFPAGLTEVELNDQIKLHEDHNKGQEIITPEAIAEAQNKRAASLELIGDKTNVAESVTE